MSKIPATPWKYDKRSEFILDDSKQAVSMTLEGGDYDEHATSEFIVRAVNAHDQLVESVKALLGCMSLAGWEDDFVAHQARAALKAAEA